MVQERMVRQLRAWGEYGAADWFQTFWCGNRGTWTMRDAGIGLTTMVWRVIGRILRRRFAVLLGSLDSYTSMCLPAT